MGEPRSSKLLYCFLREKYATLGIIKDERSTADGATGILEYVCHSDDHDCVTRKCKLSDYGDNSGARSPWFEQ